MRELVLQVVDSAFKSVAIHGLPHRAVDGHCHRHGPGNSEMGFSGGTSTWQWQLPAHFPPGKTVRVTIASGTLLQSGVQLVQSAEGFYTVSLNAGTLTLIEIVPVLHGAQELRRIFAVQRRHHR
jgi:hypothetical protein